MSTSAAKFYDIFWSDPHCQEIFLLHKEQLLEKEEIEIGEEKNAYYLQRFVISNLLENEKAYEKITRRLQNRKIDLDKNIEIISNKNFNEGKINDFFEKKFGRVIQKFSDLNNGTRFSQIKFISNLTGALGSEKKMIKFLQKYEVITKEINSFEEIGTGINHFLETEFPKILTSEHFKDILTSLDNLAEYYSNHNFYNLIDANKFYVDVLYDKENFKSRMELFDHLYECGSFIGGKHKSYFECTTCGIDTFSGNVTLNVCPSKIKLKCPNCAKPVFYLVPYSIEQRLFEDIISKDGLLHAAVSNLLQSLRHNFQANVNFSSDIECDFVLFKKGTEIITDIIEVKMFKTDRPDDTTISNLKTGLNKFLKAREKLVVLKSSFQQTNFHFLTNINNEFVLGDLKAEFKDKITGNCILIQDLAQMKNYISNI